MQNILFFLSYFENYFLLVIFLFICISAFIYGLTETKFTFKSFKVWVAGFIIGFIFSFLILRFALFLLAVILFFIPFGIYNSLRHHIPLDSYPRELLIAQIFMLFLWFFPLIAIFLGKITRSFFKSSNTKLLSPFSNAKRLCLSIVILLFGSLLVYWRFFAYIPLNWKIYTNTQTSYHYSFAYPKEWIVSECGKGEVVVAKKAMSKCYYLSDAPQEYLDNVYFQVFIPGNYEGSLHIPQKFKNWKVYEPYDDNGAFILVSNPIIPIAKTVKYSGFGPFLVGFFTHTHNDKQVENILLHAFNYPKDWLSCSFSFICK